MTVFNLYLYHLINDVFKILKFRTPISIYSLFSLSNRIGKETLLLTSTPSTSYVSRASTAWNIVRQKLSISELTTTTSQTKSLMRNIIFSTQNSGEPNDWNKELNNLIYAYKNINLAPNSTGKIS